MKKILFFLAIIFTITAVAQEPTFRKNFNYSSIDISGRMIQTSDGNFVYCGMGTNFLPIRGFVGKIDQSGDIIWSKSVTSGLATGFMDVIEISPALGGGLLLSGESSSGAFMMRVDNNANLIWAQGYQFPSSGGAYFSKAIQTSDGNFLAAGGVTHFWDGTAYRDSTMPMAIKVNPVDGSVIWGRAYYIAVANPDEHWFNDIAEVSDGYVFAGASSEGTGTLNDNGDYPRDGLIIKTDASGNTIYTQKFGASAQGEGIGSAITLSTGRVLMGGYRGDQACLLRFVGTGGTPSIEWGHRYSGGFLGVHMFDEVMETPDGHYAALGSYILPLSFSFNITALKINNSTGARIHGRTYQGGMSSILPKGGVTSTGSYYLMMMAMGGMGHNYHILKTDVGGVMNNSACPEGDYNPSRSNYIPGLISITPTVHTNVTSSAFIPVIADLNPTVTVECEYAPCVPPPIPTLTAVPNPICAGQTVTLTAGGSGPNVTYHFYTVPTGGTAFATGTTTDVTPSITTTYYVAAEDNTNPGCMSDRASVTVTVHPLPNPNVTSNSPLCEGGTLNLSAQNGTGYSWLGPGSWSSSGSGTPSISPVNTSHSGTYSVTVTDANGCSSSASVIVTVDATPVVTVNPSAPVICDGESVNLTAGGATSYNWSGLGAGASQNVSPSTTTTYYVTGTTGACTGSTQVTVNVNPSPTVSISPSSPEICEGGSVSITASGASSYVWDNGLSPGSSHNVSPSGTTTYTVTGTASGCTGTSSVTVIVNPNPVVSVSPSNPVICEGDDVLLTGNGATTYVWDQGLGAGTSHTVSPSGTTTYSVTGTTGACIGTTQVTVTVSPNPVISISPSAPNICDGQSVTINASGATSYNWDGLGAGSSQNVSPTVTTTYTVTGTSGSCEGTAEVTVTVAYQYDATISPVSPMCEYVSAFNLNAADAGGTWSGNGVTDPAAGTFDPSAAGAGTHTITYAIPGTCGDTATMNITVHAAPVVNLGANTSICDGDVLTLDAGAGYNGYNWSPSGSTQTYDVTTSGTYSVTVTDANGCQGSHGITVAVMSQADATITTTGPYCSNDPQTQFTATDAGGTWSGSGITAGGMFNPSTAGAGTHTITYGIPGSCGDTATMNITVHAAPVVNLGANTSICDGDVLTLDAGAGYNGYNWSPSGSNQTYDVTTSGTYSVTVIDANGCQGSHGITVTVMSQADATITTTGPYCSNDPQTQFTATDAGGTWSGNGITAGGMFNPSAAGAGTHLITYAIAGSCGDTASVSITVYAAPDVDLGSDQIICEGDSVVLDAGTGNIYTWTPSGSTQTINVTTSGTYSVTVTDSNGCQGTASVVITVLDLQDATIITDGPFCSNDASIQFFAEDGGGTWTGTGISSGGMFNPSGAGQGNHTITYTIPGQCGDTDSKIITVNEAPQISLVSTGESCIGATDGNITLTLTGGTSPYIILWQHGSSDENLTNLAPGTYSVMVADQNGCGDSSSVTVLGGMEDCFPPHIYIPNVFSPNGDGQNDILFARGEGVRFLELLIYNRWGEKIFESTALNNGWDGTYKGKPCDSGVYAYVLKVIFNNDEEIKTHGNITLVR